ncbi:hypothetical protein N431DRAFT_376065, partial [Stipitochalara longipes BDJ]
MSDARSNGGCWTCRVRRKKCDETHPTCLTCTSLHIPCYGYGPKPTWMDRGAKEREVAKSLRNAVKQTISLQRMRQSLQSSDASETASHGPEPPSRPNEASPYDVPSSQDVPVTNVMLSEGLSSAKENNTSSPFNGSASPRTVGSQDCHTSPLNPNSPSLAVGEIAGVTHNESLDLILTSNNWSVLPLQFEEDQASLLMHFFDHVLPLQFRFYNPSILEGGRGWILSILTRTKPLYHVALSLAAYHQQSILVRSNQIPCTASLRKLEERYIECIKALRCHLEQFPIGPEANTCETNIEIMACIALLIALDLFRGDTNHWQMHLKAASSLSFKFQRDQLRECPLSKTRRLAVEFFAGVITWYDVLSCASTGQRPFSNFGDINEDAFIPIQFDKLMGCESWVVHLIAEIATLSKWKRRMEATGTLSTWELVRRVTDIELRLETGLSNVSGRQNELTTMDVTSSTISSNPSESLIQNITRIFACGALVYLQVIISGPYPALPEIQQGVSRTMAAINALADKELLRNVLWPVCIAGCMATEENESYWRDLISSVSQDRWSFGYPSKVLQIMEECWRLRKRQPRTALAVDWMTAMNNLDMKILLV